MSGPHFAAHLVSRDPEGPREWMHHRDAVGVLETQCLDEVLPLLREAEAATRQGLWAVGWIAYEAAPAFDPALEVHDPSPGLPLLRFVLYRDAVRGLPKRATAQYQLSEFEPSVSCEAFSRQMQSVKEAIARGETYQVNLTYAGSLRLVGPAWDWFRDARLARPGPYPFYLEEPGRTVLSLSPELFFHQQKEQIFCRPMKGTAQPGQARSLSASIKDRAENVMIVDMIRNDLGKIADTGSVEVTSLFDVEPYPSVTQMTSTIGATGSRSVVDWLTALFPCASITGAPKRSTQSLIRSLENGPRGIYTGCIGWIAPDGRAEFNVAIRTAVLNPATGRVRYHTGCGIVWDSDPVREYEESLLKTRALHRKETPYQLIETMRVEADGSVPLLEMHLERLLQSAAQLGFEAKASEIRTGIQAQTSRAREVSKLRLVLHANGELVLKITPLPQSPHPMTFRVDSEATPSDHPELRHKTTRRTVYTEARERVPDADETLLINERGELMEFSIGNLLLRVRDRWLTPPLESGPLSGIRRRRELSGPQVQEQVLTLAELEQADEIFLTNAVRGRVPMRWLRTHHSDDGNRAAGHAPRRARVPRRTPPRRREP